MPADLLYQNPEDVLLQRQLDPNGQYTSKRYKDVGIKMTAQENYLFELVSNLLDSGLNDFNYNTTELRRLYAVAKKRISPEDLVQAKGINPSDAAYPSYLAQAEEAYNAIFNSQQEEGVRDFLALTLTNKEFREVLEPINGSRVDQPIIGDSIFNTATKFI